MDNISNAYSTIIETYGKKWYDLASRTPSAIIWHDKSLLLNEDLNDKDLDDWIQKTDKGYPIPSASIINKQRLSTLDNRFHDEFMNRQPDQKLVDLHKANLNEDDYTNVHHLVKNGLLYGHTSGSSDINDHLLKHHLAGTDSENIFVRGFKDNIDKPYQELNIKSINDTIGKNRFTSTTTYHGIGFSVNQQASKLGLLHLPSFTSGSLNRNIALRYAKAAKINKRLNEHHILMIHHPIGSRGLYIGNDPDLTDFNDNEIILPKNIVLNVSKHTNEYLVGKHKVNVYTANRMTNLETED